MVIFSSHSPFGLKHILILVACMIITVFLFIFSKKLNLKQACKTLLIIGIISEIIKVFYYIIANEATHNGYLPKTDLPFHLCSMQIVFIFIVNLTDNEKIKKTIFSFMMPTCLFGGIAALLLPTTSSLNAMWILSAQYFLYHVAIIVFALYLRINCKELKWSIKDYFNCAKFLGVIGILAIYLNSWINDGSNKINFMYVVSPPMEGLPFLNKNNGWFVYICHYAFLAYTLLTLFYIKPIIQFFKDKKNSKKEIHDYVC